MKLPFATALITTAMLGSAAAQTPPKPSDIKPRPVATVPIHPSGAPVPQDVAKVREQGERLSIQSDLAWINLYNGAINGEASDRLVAAIKNIPEKS